MNGFLKKTGIALLAVLLLAGGFFLAQGIDERYLKGASETVPERTETPEPTAAPTPTAEPTPTPEPSPTPAPTRTPNENDTLPTLTPEITFVPLPTSVPKPDRHGRTPSPSPSWVTPFPSPEESETWARSGETVLLGTVKDETGKGIRVRKKEGYAGYSLGTAKNGDQYAVLEEAGAYCKILFQGAEGWFPSENLSVETKSCVQTGVIAYTIGSLNVHAVGSDTRVRKVSEILKEVNADVVGIQEVYRGTEESEDKTDWLVKLAEASEYPYFTFTKTLKRNGRDFGTAILSRYPIVFAENHALEVYHGKEPRAIGYIGILTEKGLAGIFNTHLCASEMHLKSVNIASMAHVLDAAEPEIYTVTGDFNCSPLRINHYMPEIRYANIDKGTFNSTSTTRPKILDNILYTEGISVSDVRLIDTIETGVTDHKMVVATVHVLIPEDPVG